LAVNNEPYHSDKTLIYSAGSEGVIRIWGIPKQIPPLYQKNEGKNYCLGVFSSHKDIVW
jgi:hypothetical protein